MKFALLLLLSLTASGCLGIPKGRYWLDDVKITGNEKLGDDEVLEKLATRETPRFLGVFPGVIYDYEIFDRYVLERDLQRIERFYHARGYYTARARAARVVYDGRSAQVHIVVEEGPPVLVRRIDIHGLDGLPKEVAARARSRVESIIPMGEAFDEDLFAQADEQLLYALAEQGYARAKTKKVANVDLPRQAVSVGFWVEAGPLSRFGDVRIVGLGALPEEPVRRALGIQPGSPYSQSEIEEAERAVLNLGVFSAVDIDPDPTREREGNVVPLLVTLEPSRLRSVQLGGGVQIDSLRADVHLTAGWEDRNFLGGMRRFQVLTQPGIVLYPTRLPDFQAPEKLLPMVRLRTEFRQPGFIERRTNALVRAEGSIYPVLHSTEYDERTPVIGYRDARLSTGLERSYWKFYSALTQNFQVNSPFTYIGPLDRDLGTVLISYPELFSTLDLRNDALRPHSGLYVANTLQFAGLGGDARDVKVSPEVRGYIPLGRELTLAARTAVGFLFAGNYGDTVDVNARTGTSGDSSRADWVRDIQIMFLRGFFSGGPGSNRGYPLRTIGPHGIVPFYNPGQTPTALIEQCNPTAPEYSESVCDLPLGGFTLWEASLELRFPIMTPLYGAVFGDASDVSAKEVHFRFNHPHVSAGAGLRYDTPIGPIRVDVGYRIPGLQAPDTPDEHRPDDIFGLPIAVSFGIGESF